MKTSPLLLLASLTGVLIQQPQATPPLVHPCEILRNLSKYYGGQMVQVRGQWTGPSLTEPCPVVLRAGTYTWENYITIEKPESLKGVLFEEADFSLDETSWERAKTALREFQRIEGEDVVVYATITGRLDSRPFEIPHELSGYGHLGQYPARLVIKTIRDVSLRP